MIGRLSGTVIAQEPDGTVVLDVNGVGYDLVVPLGTVGRAEGKDGRATFFVHTHVREDQLSLFGFASDSDRFAFRTLIGVSNVGPKTAIQVLSALPALELGRAIAQKDVSKLTSIPGIGKKTAERLVLELRDKLPTGPEPATPAAKPAAKAGTPAEVLVGTLVNMGYKPAEAERAVAQLEGRLDAPLPELIREALGLLAK
jgi:holliday junction DNA helicase RuvA